MHIPRACGLVLLCGLIHAGCEPGVRETDGARGTLSVALESSQTSDVSAVRFEIVSFEQACGSAPIASLTKTLLRHSSAPGHAFSGALFLLAPGNYRVCASPLSGESASAECAPVDGLATVIAGQTAQLALTSQCRGAGAGALGVTVTLNHPPSITSLNVNPSDYITVCESLTLSAAASDPDGDEFLFHWSQLFGPAGANLRANQAEVVLSGPEGDYLIGLTVDDGKGGVATLSVPAHISSETCAVPPQVAELFVAKCSPCHTTNPSPSAGMRLAPADTAYENLVLRSVAGATCTDRTRVVPGDAGSSYIVAKLRGLPEICGVQMPRGRPPLAENEIGIVESWINGLPH